MREIESARGVLGFNRAHNPRDFETAVDQIVSGFNFLYADRVGNIGFWQAGHVPVRPSGFDPRLPLPGDGTAEWPGGTLPNPSSVNPAQGWLTNWNFKPTLDWNNPDHQTFGKYDRLSNLQRGIEDHLPNLSLEDMRDIAVKYVAPTPPGTTSAGGPGQLQTKGVAVEQLKPYLFAALNAIPRQNPLAARAAALLQGWNGDVYTDAISGTTLHPGYVVFSAWLNGVPEDVACNNPLKRAKGMLCNTFFDDLPTTFNLATDRATVNLLVHVLDHACHIGVIGDPGICPNDSGVPPSRDYFNNVHPNDVISGSFDQALAALGPEAAWSGQPRTTIPFHHALGIPGLDTGSNCLLCSPPLPPLLGSHRATYAQLIDLSSPTMYSENILPLGQNGFIPYPLALDRLVHFDDQLSLYRNFEYKRMRLYRNTQLKE